MVEIEGDRNIANMGYITGDCVIGQKIINVIFTSNKIISMDSKESLNNQLSELVKSQTSLNEAISSFSEAELIRARADENNSLANINNSLANLNYSKASLHDREMMSRLIDSIEKLKKK